jgi:lipid A 4'-phosphatase
MNRSGLIIVLSVAFVTGLALGLFPLIDLRVAQILKDSVFAAGLSSTLREFAFWVEILLIAPPVTALMIKLLLPHTKMLMSGCAIVFLTASLILGPGLLVNVTLKNHWGRPRPGHIVQFGGDQHFVAWWDPRGECQRNCSFVSGEASSAFWTIAPAALAPPAWRALAYSAAIAFGTIISASRLMMGGHFLSDTIFAGVFTFLVIWLMYALVYRWQPTRLDNKGIEDALTRLSNWCRTTISQLVHRSKLRSLIALACIYLGACTQSPRPLAPSDLNSDPYHTEMTPGAGQTAEREQKEGCAKISELAVGMTTSQVISLSCEGRPFRTEEVVTKKGKHQIIWSYKGGYLEFENDKLARIRLVQ